MPALIVPMTRLSSPGFMTLAWLHLSLAMDERRAGSDLLLTNTVPSDPPALAGHTGMGVTGPPATPSSGTSALPNSSSVPSMLQITLDGNLDNGDAFGVKATVDEKPQVFEVILEGTAGMSPTSPQVSIIVPVTKVFPAPVTNEATVSMVFLINSNDTLSVDSASPFITTFKNMNYPTAPLGITLGSAGKGYYGSLVLGGYDSRRVEKLHWVNWRPWTNTIQAAIPVSGKQKFDARLDSTISSIILPSSLQDSIPCDDLSFEFSSNGTDAFTVKIPLETIVPNYKSGSCPTDVIQFTNAENLVTLGRPFLQAAYFVLYGEEVYLGQSVFSPDGITPSAFNSSSLASYSVSAPSSPTSTSTPSSTAVSSATVQPAKSNVGAIAGGVVGGLAGLILVILAILFLCRRRALKKRSSGYETTRGEVAYRGTGMSSNSLPTTYESQYMQPPKSYDPVPTVTEYRTGIYNPQPNVQRQSQYSDQQSTAYEPRPLIHAPIPIRPQASSPTPAAPEPIGPNELDSREVNEDGVSVRSLSPDPDMDARLGSYEGPTPTPEAQAARGNVARLPLASRTNDERKRSSSVS